MLARDAAQGGALPRARAAGMLAEASYALYQTERHPQPRPSTGRPRWWRATTPCAAPRRSLRGCPTGLPAAVRGAADRRRRRTSPTATRRSGPVCSTATAGPPPRCPQRPALDWPTDLGRELYPLADLRVWLDGLRDDLGRIASTPADDDLRTRVAHLADGAS